jgi:aspartate beta-hydroxylase
VIEHYGPTNKKLRVYFPIIVPDCNNEEGRSTTCWIQVNHIKKYLKPGECLVFDDSYMHDAANESLSSPRIVFIFDIWHPDLSDEEIKVLEFINKGQILAAKRLAKLETKEEDGKKDDFFSVIHSSIEKGIDETEVNNIWGK